MLSGISRIQHGAKDGGHIVKIIVDLATSQISPHLGGQSADECFKGTSSDYPHQD